MERDERDQRIHTTKSVVWGFFLMAIGGAFLLDHLHVVDLPPVGRMWPAIFAVFSLLNLVEGRFGAALTNVLIGAWFFICEFHWHGLDYGNSWPLVLVAVGAGIVVRALGNEPPRRMRMGGGSW
jgi:hypothetical protein